MDLETLILKLEALQQNLPEFHRRTTEQLAVSSLSLAKNRIQLKEGIPGEVYSDAYAKSKRFKQKGKSKSKVNLTFSGQMMADLQVQRAEIRGNQVVAIIGVSSQDYLKYNVDRYGNVFQPTQTELDILSESFKRAYSRFLTNGLNG